MSTWAELEARYRGAPYFHVLYVGPDDRRAETFLAAVGRLPGVRKTGRARGPEEVAAVCRRDGLELADDQGCLIPAIDAGPTADEQTVLGLLLALRSSSLPRFVIGAVAAGSARFTLPELVRCTAADIAWVGDRDLADVIATWLAPDTGPTTSFDLTRAGRKQPHYWLAHFAHDYFSNAVLLPNLLSLIRTAGLEDEQRTLDFLVYTVSKVLLTPGGSSGQPDKHRQMKPDLPVNDAALAQAVYRARTRLLVSSQLAAVVGAAVTAEGLSESVAVRSWTTADEVRSLTAACRADGDAPVVLCGPDDLPGLTFDGIPPATVIISDPEFRTGWDDWRRLLARNVIGAYPVAALGPSLSAKHVAWRTFAVLPLPAAVNRMIELAAVTHDRLDDLADWGSFSDFKAERLRKLYFCAAHLRFVRELYFAA